MKSGRDVVLEGRLQKVLDEGGQVWAIGDVHGFVRHLNLLINQIQPSSTTQIILLGDLIDRGPASHEVVALAREHPYLHPMKGNHEVMFAQALTARVNQTGGTNEVNNQYTSWSKCGGEQTEQGYQRVWGERTSRKMMEDAMWLNALPEVIVLNRWILCHAGIDPTLEIDEQSSDVLLWTRRLFDETHGSYGSERTVVHGHVVTGTLEQGRWGKPHISTLKLPDGRPARIGIDTSAYSKSSNILTAIKLGMDTNPFFIYSDGKSSWPGSVNSS